MYSFMSLPGPSLARLATMITPIVRLPFDHGIALPNHHSLVRLVSRSLPVARASLTKTCVDWKTDHILGMGSKFERARFSNVSSEKGMKSATWDVIQSCGLARENPSAWRLRVLGDLREFQEKKRLFFSLNICPAASSNTVQRVTIT